MKTMLACFTVINLTNCG